MDWPCGLITQSEDADIPEDGQTKAEVEIALQEELKVMYNRPKPIRGEKSLRKRSPRWFETFLSPWILL